MISFSDWIDQFVEESYFLGALACDVADDINFPNESNSFEEIENYIKSDWCSNDHYLKQFKDAFVLYEKEKVTAN